MGTSQNGIGPLRVKVQVNGASAIAEVENNKIESVWNPADEVWENYELMSIDEQYEIHGQVQAAMALNGYRAEIQ